MAIKYELGGSVRGERKSGAASTHGLYKHPLYYTCKGAINRCHNEKDRDPKDSNLLVGKRDKDRAIEYMGHTRNMAEWERVLGMGSRTLQRRLRVGWTVDEALSVPKRMSRA